MGKEKRLKLVRKLYSLRNEMWILIVVGKIIKYSYVFTTIRCELGTILQNYPSKLYINGRDFF